MSDQGPDQTLRESARRVLRASRGRQDRQQPAPAKSERSPRWFLEFSVAVLIAVALIVLVLGLQTGLFG